MTTTTATLTDAFGTTINVGDLLVFAVRQGSKQWLNKLKVTAVTDEVVRGYDPNDVNQRQKSLRQTKTIVVLESAHVGHDHDESTINTGTNHELAS